MVSLYADDDTKYHLRYGVTVKGIIEEIQIFIMRYLETSNSEGRLCCHWNKYHTEFNIIVFAPSYMPDAEVKFALFNLHT